MEFKDFLLGENKSYFAVKTGDILSSLQDIYSDADVLDKKNIYTYIKNIVNQIRPLLKINIDKNYLLVLQKVAVSLMKDVDEKNDPKDTIQSSIKELESLLSSNGVPINKINITKSKQQISTSEDKS
mgnify:CR=1 FL=1